MKLFSPKYQLEWCEHHRLMINDCQRRFPLNKMWHWRCIMTWLNSCFSWTNHIFINLQLCFVHTCCWWKSQKVSYVTDFFSFHSAARKTPTNKQDPLQQLTLKHSSHLTTGSQSLQPISFKTDAASKCKLRLGNPCVLLGKENSRSWFGLFLKLPDVKTNKHSQGIWPETLQQDTLTVIGPVKLKLWSILFICLHN